MYAKSIAKRCLEIIEPKLEDTTVRPGRRNADRILLTNKFSRNL